MAGMGTVFGEVAEVYDEVRPGYPPEIAEAVLAYHGGVPDEVVELGAGTGKGTEVLLRLGAPVTCVEPDPRMAAVLGARFPQVTIHPDTFERWTPPAGGVPVIACALAWHWLDEQTRNQRAYGCLTPGGTLAVFGHRYGYADPEHARAIDAAFRSVDPNLRHRDEDWIYRDVGDSGLFADVQPRVFSRRLELTKERYLQLVQTWGPYRRGSPERRARGLQAVGPVLDRLGGSVVLDLRTSLVLARRPAG